MRHFIAILLTVGLLWTGCDIFSPRAPEDPLNEAGTFIQPDAPDVVVDNLQAAISELNPVNYGRSLSDALVFEATSTALASDPILTGWDKDDEVGYFTTLAADAQAGDTHELRLTDTIEDISATRYTLEANYLLTVEHRRVDVPEVVQGRLFWDIRQGQDGLWRLEQWTDRELGNAPSWSTLKAAFGK